MVDLTEIDDIIAKFQELKKVSTSAKELIENEKYLTANDIADIMGCSVEAARAYMARPDFPKLKIGKGYKVSATTFFLYNLQARTQVVIKILQVQKHIIDEHLRLTKAFWNGGGEPEIRERTRYSEIHFGEYWVAMNEIVDCLFRVNGLNPNASNEVYYRMLRLAGVQII